ncbi:phage tail termination protein [Streptomyces sp. SAS_275]|uniref:phage tail termination protein n=1 Tax=Streptomyces sp. SAS_275 TaxID=3412746 RepID=UPI00403C5582
MTALVDIELELISRATARFPDAVVRDELDNRLLNELPTIQIEQIPGGGDDGLLLSRPIVDINVYAATRPDAITLAREVHDWVTRELRGSTSDSTVIGRTGCLSLPAIRPYENTSLRRVGGTYEIFCHPVS